VSPTLLIALLVAGLLALIPLRRLRAADWPDRWLQAAWVVLFGLTAGVVLVPLGGRFLAPILLVVFALPFWLGEDRLRRLARRSPRSPTGVVIDVTPRAREDRPADAAPGGPPPTT
jgi:uncharacterized membrane protein YfcA